MITSAKQIQRYGLPQYAGLLIAFACSLLVLGVYQHFRLYLNGILDSVFEWSMLMLFVNQIGYAAIVGLLLVYPYKWLEANKPSHGKKTVSFLFTLLLALEFVLIEYFLQHLDLIGSDIATTLNHVNFRVSELFYAGVCLFICLGIFRFVSKKGTKLYNFIQKLYPFTIILALLFAGMLFTDKRAINVNKTQYLVADLFSGNIEKTIYKGEAEYPLVQPTTLETDWTTYFSFKNQKPNIVIVMIDGLSNEFVGTSAKFKEFTPFLSKLSQQSLVFTNHLSTSLETPTALTTLLSSSPFPAEGTAHFSSKLNKNSLFAYLKSQGYKTGFYHGGNLVLTKLDSYLFNERVDMVFDRSNFGDHFKTFETDASGAILGFPDEELFKKWEEIYLPTAKPKFEVFLNLSTETKSLHTPAEQFIEAAEKQIEMVGYEPSLKRRMDKNISFFANLMYTDQALEGFLEKHKKTNEFDNTIFVFVGSKNAPAIEKNNSLGFYKTGMFIYSPLLKQGKEFEHLTSHFDVVPSIISMVNSVKPHTTLTHNSWLGEGLLSTKNKTIPLLKREGRFTELITGESFFNGGKVYALDVENEMGLVKNEENTKAVYKQFQEFKAIANYTLTKNKLLPDSLAIFPVDRYDFKKEELVWLSSVFDGEDYDKAFREATKLAHKGNTSRALLLAEYIIHNVPGHVDAMILKGRIYGWNQQYAKSKDVLEVALGLNPKYQDCYAALLDVCYWSNDVSLASELFQKIKTNGVGSVELDEKVNRCLGQQTVSEVILID